MRRYGESAWRTAPVSLQLTHGSVRLGATRWTRTSTRNCWVAMWSHVWASSSVGVANMRSQSGYHTGICVILTECTGFQCKRLHCVVLQCMGFDGTTRSLWHLEYVIYDLYSN